MLFGADENKQLKKGALSIFTISGPVWICRGSVTYLDVTQPFLPYMPPSVQTPMSTGSSRTWQ